MECACSRTPRPRGGGPTHEKSRASSLHHPFPRAADLPVAPIGVVGWLAPRWTSVTITCRALPVIRRAATGPARARGRANRVASGNKAGQRRTVSSAHVHRADVRPPLVAPADHHGALHPGGALLIGLSPPPCASHADARPRARSTSAGSGVIAASSDRFASCTSFPPPALAARCSSPFPRNLIWPFATLGAKCTTQGTGSPAAMLPTMPFRSRAATTPESATNVAPLAHFSFPSCARIAAAYSSGKW